MQTEELEAKLQKRKELLQESKYKVTRLQEAIACSEKDISMLKQHIQVEKEKITKLIVEKEQIEEELKSLNQG